MPTGFAESSYTPAGTDEAIVFYEVEFRDWDGTTITTSYFMFSSPSLYYLIQMAGIIQTADCHTIIIEVYN